MAEFVSLGKIEVAAAGTPVQITSTQAQANSIVIRALQANAGELYIGLSTMNNSTLADVIFYLTAGETWSSGSLGLNDIDPSRLYIDCETGNTDGCLASLFLR